MIQALKPLSDAVRSLHKRMTGARAATVAELAQIRTAMLEHMLDCDIKTVRRVRLQMESATTALQLWMLRSEVYQAVSEQFGQHEAAQRVARLGPLFRGLVPQRKLRQNK
ncbi:MAG: hypothetical protein Q4G71_01085 [Pseudomonadota bacterium]|nr:hypothetical protein [Pseudomonadota bacterium]